MSGRTAIIILLAVGLLAACGDSGADAGAELACRSFRSTASDQTAGLLTPGELRSKLQGINNDARLSEEPGIASAGRDMVAASTAGDDAALADAVTRFGQACDAAGADL